MFLSAGALPSHNPTIGGTNNRGITHEPKIGGSSETRRTPRSLLDLVRSLFSVSVSSWWEHREEKEYVVIKGITAAFVGLRCRGSHRRCARECCGLSVGYVWTLSQPFSQVKKLIEPQYQDEAPSPGEAKTYR